MQDICLRNLESKWPVIWASLTLSATTWIWNLHVDAHDFDSHTNDLEDIYGNIFSAHFGQPSIIFIWQNISIILPLQERLLYLLLMQLFSILVLTKTFCKITFL